MTAPKPLSEWVREAVAWLGSERSDIVLAGRRRLEGAADEIAALECTAEQRRCLADELQSENAALRAELEAARKVVEEAAKRTAEVERERDAYKRAKAENDERFMLERDALRATLDGIERLLRAGWVLRRNLDKNLPGEFYFYNTREAGGIMPQPTLPAAVQAALEELDR